MLASQKQPKALQSKHLQKLKHKDFDHKSKIYVVNSPADQKKFENTTQRALCLAGRNSAYKTTDCGAPPMPKPTRPRRISNQANTGAIDDNAPK